MKGQRSAPEKNWLFVDDETQFRDLKEAGRWIRAHSEAGRRVVCYDTVITYYSKVTIIGLPYSPPVQVLGYVRSHEPDFIVLDTRDASLFPAVKEWIAHGIPDYRAQLVFDTGSTDGSRSEIYRWRHSGRRNS